MDLELNPPDPGTINYTTNIHGRLIHAVKILKLKMNKFLVLTGSEDTNINIYMMNPETNGRLLYKIRPKIFE